jgi:hypothetical protein
MVFIEGELNARAGGILTGELFGLPAADDWLVVVVTDPVGSRTPLEDVFHFELVLLIF